MEEHPDYLSQVDEQCGDEESDQNITVIWAYQRILMDQKGTPSLNSYAYNSPTSEDALAAEMEALEHLMHDIKGTHPLEPSDCPSLMS